MDAESVDILIAEFSGLALLRPEDPIIHKTLAVLHFLSGETQKAVIYNSKFRESNSNEFKIEQNRGERSNFKDHNYFQEWSDNLALLDIVNTLQQLVKEGKHEKALDLLIRQLSINSTKELWYFLSETSRELGYTHLANFALLNFLNIDEF